MKGLDNQKISLLPRPDVPKVEIRGTEWSLSSTHKRENRDVLEILLLVIHNPGFRLS